MKKGFYIGVVIVLQIAILVKIGQLEKELNNTKNYITNKLRDQSSEIMSLYSNMEQKLKADNSLIENFDYSYGNVDKEGFKVDMTLNITPKEVRDNTNVKLNICGREYETTREDTSFRAVVPVGLFDDIDAKVIIDDGEVQKTQLLDIFESPRYRFIPAVFIQYSGSMGKYTQKDKEGTYQLKGKISIEAKAVLGNTLESAFLVSEVDGKVISEEPLSTGGSGLILTRKLTLKQVKALK